MNEELNVDIRDLSPVRVVLLEYNSEGLKGSYSGSIGTLFQELAGWLHLHGHNHDRLLRYGVPFTEGEKLVRYWCCIEAPEGVTTGEGPVQVRELAGGRYVVLTMAKDPHTIGPGIERFYNDFAPSHGMSLDESRPPIEIYHPQTIEYCAPLRPEANDHGAVD